jgi:uncharacterized protein (DUF433 family)/DNA-binding transcriptional MerR regulator
MPTIGTVRITGIALGKGVYSSRLTAKLAGVSLRQLRYWVKKELISPGSYDAPYRGRDLFAYPDIVQARVIGRMRDAELPLQRISKAVAWLRNVMQSQSDWHTKTMITDGKDVFVMLGPHEAETYSVVTQPGQAVIKISLGDIAAELTKAGELLGLGDHLDADPAVLGGTPVIRNTRVPTSLVHQLLGEGQSVEEIRAMYPGIDEEAVRAAEEFEQQLAAV